MRNSAGIPLQPIPTGTLSIPEIDMSKLSEQNERIIRESLDNYQREQAQIRRQSHIKNPKYQSNEELMAHSVRKGSTVYGNFVKDFKHEFDVTEISSITAEEIDAELSRFAMRGMGNYIKEIEQNTE